jgi:predicted aconitase
VTEEDARLQARVLAAYEAMGVTMSCTCAPYLTQPAPLFGTHLAWAESSAVTVANSLLGARTEREGGPGALAAALCGFTPYTGLHLDANRRPRVGVRVTARLGGPALFHVVERTPEAATFPTLPAQVTVTDADLDDEAARLTDLQPGEGVDLVFSGCPHPVAGTQACFFHRDVPVAEVAGNAPWTLLAAPGDAATSVQGDAATSVQADAGTSVQADAGTSVQADAGTSVQAGRILTLPGGCPAVSPLPPEVKTIVTDSAKAAFYLRSRGYRVGLAPTQRCVELGSTGRWPHAT